MAPLTAAEIVKHPAYDALAWNLPPTKTGTCPVAQKRRGGPLNLYYEIHGTGPAKLVVCSYAAIQSQPLIHSTNNET
jgi:hypothetical protein